VIATVVGSGTLVPSARRSTPALVVEEDGVQLTIDGGSGTLRRQAELGIDFRNTAALLYTHVHPDHSLDLLHFLFATGHTPGFERTEPVRLVGPPGFSRFVAHLRDGVRSWTEAGPGGIAIEELGDGDGLAVGPLRITATALAHAVTDHGYRITAPSGRSFAFTGDTGWCDGLLRLARAADVLVCECSGDAAHPMTGHLTAPEAGRLAAGAGVGQLVLSHLYPLPDDRIRLEEAAAEFGGPILLAEDGDRFIV
jgi:ribonuclease BN (tRNA processing enzyme)